MSASSSVETTEPDERPIVFHYILVILIELATIATLAWIAAAFR